MYSWLFNGVDYLIHPVPLYAAKVRVWCGMAVCVIIGPRSYQENCIKKLLIYRVIKKILSRIS